MADCTPGFEHLPQLFDALLARAVTAPELVTLYETIWQARQLTHVVMLTLLLFTGIRNAELVRLRLTDVDLQTCQVRIAQGKGQKDRSVLIPTSFRGELAQYMERQRTQGARSLFESNRLTGADHEGISITALAPANSGRSHAPLLV
jgi:site-specific recombinase XerD